MTLFEEIENVKGREELIQFIHSLRKDLQTNKEEWENTTLEDFLEAMAAWVNDMEGYYLHSNEPMPTQPSWKTIADILYASSKYE